MLDKNPSMGIPSASNTSSSTSAALFSIPVNLSSASIASNKLTIVKSLSASRGFEESLLSDFEAITSKYNNKKNLSSSEQYLSATDDAAAAHPPSSLSTSPASPGLPLTRAGTRKPNNSNNNLIIACYVKVLHDYIPRDADELGLEEEDVVTLYKADIMEKDSSGWLYGENNGNWGFFPASHVKFLTEEEALAEGIATSSSLTNATTTTTNGGTASSSLHSLQRDTTGTEQASSSGSGGGGTTKAWFSKYKKMPRYEKKMPSSNKIGLAFDDGTTTAPFATMKNNSISHSSETLISENDDNNSNKQNTTTTTTDSSLTRNRKTSDPVSRSDSHLNVESDLNRSKSVRKPSDTTTTTLHNGTTNATSNTILVTAPLPSVSTSATSPAATAPTIVSIVGAPAVMKPRWVDFMGGNEAVSKLGLTKKEIQRQEVIYEILTTERDYVNDLEIVIEIYIKGLKEKKMLRPKDEKVIFSNIEQILPVNNMLLGWIEERHKASSVLEQMGDVFIRVSDYLKMYTMYCSNHPYALMKLENVRQNKAVAKFLDQCANTPESRHLNLANFLLKPVQRICKYPLLIREMIKSTDSTHVDSENLVKALLKIETVVTIVNEGARQAENVHKMLDLQGKFTSKINIIIPSRVLIKNGSMDLINASGERKKREFYLFNDSFLVAKTQGDDKLKHIAMVPFDMILINSITDSPGKEHMLEIVHVGTAKFTVVTESNYSKQQWMKHFKEATSSWVDMKAKLMARAEGSEASSPATGAGIPVLSLDHSATTAAEDQFDNSNMINPMMMLERKQSVMSQLAASASTTSTSSNTNLASENAQTKQDSLQLKENGAIVVGSANSNNAVSAIIMDFANREQHARAQSTPAHQANHAPRRPPPKVPPKISERRTFAASPDNTNNVSSTHHAVINNGSSSVLNTIKELATKADSTKPVKTSNGSLEAVNLISLDGSRKIANNAFIVQDVVSAGSSPVNSTENLNKPSPNGSRARSATVDPGLQKRSGFTPIGAPNSQGITPPTPPSVPPPPIPKSPAALATSPSSASIKAPFPPPVPVKPTNKGLAGSRPSSAASTTASANASVDVTDAPTPPSSSGNTPSSSSSKPVADAASIGSIVAADVVNGMTTRSTATATGTLRIKKLQSPPLPQKMRVAESWTTAAVVKAEETVSSNVETFNGSSVSSITAKIESNNNNNSSSSRVSVAGSSARNSNVAPRDVSGSIGIVKSGSQTRLQTSATVSVTEPVIKSSEKLAASDEKSTSTERLRSQSSNTSSDIATSKPSATVKRAMTMSKGIKKPIKTAVITEVVKQSGKQKDYLYLINVSYVGGSGGVDALVQKTFDEYFDFHIQLIGHFPEEAGLRLGNSTSNAPSRIIPELPGQMMFVSESVAKARIAQLQDYTRQILALPPKISRAPVVLNFFRSEE